MDAADVAPSLLQKLDSEWGAVSGLFDLKGNKRRSDDIAAISGPVFNGAFTLDSCGIMAKTF